MRRRTFLGNRYTIAGGNVTASTAVAGDVCLYQKGTDSLVIIPQNVFDVKTYPLDSYTPVGVVVVPGTHNVYGDGSCGVMSLKLMNCNTPDNGTYDTTSSKEMVFGYFKGVLDKNYNGVVYVSHKNSTISSTVQGCQTSYTANQTYFLLPSTINSGVKNTYDTDTWYNNDGYSETDYYYLPSPYKQNNTRNNQYYKTTSPSSTSNCLSDFDGIGNTSKFLEYATSQSDWKTASTIKYSSSEGYYPATCCCWRYHTDGTKQGDWYLPAIGELGYIPPKLNNITDTLNKIKEYNKTELVFDFNEYMKNEYITLLSSTEAGWDVWNIGAFENFTIKPFSKQGVSEVLAFLRVK